MALAGARRAVPGGGGGPVSVFPVTTVSEGGSTEAAVFEKFKAKRAAAKAEREKTAALPSQKSFCHQPGHKLISGRLRHAGSRQKFIHR